MSMITYKLLTDKGDREINEDSIGMTEKDGVSMFALADGLGGHGFGEVASNSVMTSAVECFLDRDNDETLEETICSCFDYSQEMLLKKIKEESKYRDMKTTFVTLMIGEKEVQWGHIGDSRLYYFKDAKLQSRTLDHSVPQMLVATGEIKEKQIRFHEDRNKLLRVMGTEWESPKYVVEKGLDRNENMTFLLCSDGFWEYITEKEMVKTLKKSKTVEEWVLAMEKIVKKNGYGNNMDNYSAVAVFIR